MMTFLDDALFWAISMFLRACLVENLNPEKELSTLISATGALVYILAPESAV